MISYAYNREDVLLDRLFKDRDRGFFIDVGAGHPTTGSLTRHFYDKGWRGINLEPTGFLLASLEKVRPEDLNLQVALSDEAGSVDFHEFDELHWGLSTLDREQAERHAATGLSYQSRPIRVATLAEICQEHVTGEIDFVSIDVEGHERAVVVGADWKKWRPRAVVIESTQPTTEIASHQEWEPILIASGYLFAYFDGLNRYYVRAEDEALLESFKIPVNQFDLFLPYELTSKITDAESKLVAAQELVQDLQMSEAILLGDHQYFRERLERLHSQYTELAAATAGPLNAPASDGGTESVYGLGPLGMAMARRISLASARFPVLAETARKALRFGLAVRRRLRPPA